MCKMIDQYADKIKGQFSFFDRMIINGYFRPLLSEQTRIGYLYSMGIPLRDFTEYFKDVTDRLLKQIEDSAGELGRPVVYLPSAKDRKEDIAKGFLLSDPVDEGLICVLKTLESCRTAKVVGRELMKHIFDTNGISYQCYDNSFTDISDVAKAQELADRFDSTKLCRRLDAFARSLSPFLDTVQKNFGQGYFWCMDQCEFATDIMFKERSFLEDIYPSLVGHAFYDYPDSDWSYAEQYLGQEIQECISTERISSFNKNGYIVLENDNRNELIFNLVNNYKIIYCTEHYSLLIRENTENMEKLKKIGMEGLSKDGKININYYRLSNNTFKNALAHVLEEGMYRVDLATNGRNTEQKSMQGDIINSRNYNVSTLNGERSIIFWLDGNTRTTFNVYEYYTPVSADADIYISKLLWDSSPDGMDLTLVENMAYTGLGLEESGYAMYGPYISLDPGAYEVLFEMDETMGTPDILGSMDVCADFGNTLICSTAWDGSSKFVTLQFCLEERTENIEIRYFKSAGNNTIPVKVILRKIHDR